MKAAFSYHGMTGRVPKDLVIFLVITCLVFGFGWLRTEIHFNWNEAITNTYFAPFAWSFLRCALWSTAGGILAYCIYQATLRRSRQRHSEDASIADTDRKATRQISLLSCLVAAAICVGSIKAVLYAASIGSLYERITFPGTAHPAIEIRFNGFADQTPNAFLCGPLYYQNILEIPWDKTESTNSISKGRTGEGVVNMGMDNWHPYQVRWSQRGAAFAVLVNGSYLAAYDLTTGKRLQYTWWYSGPSLKELTTIKPRDKVDQEIEDFLKKR